MKVLAALVTAIVLAPASLAQQAAVSANLSPEAAADVFRSTVMDVCVPAASGGGVSASLAARGGKLRTTNDAATRKQAGAEPNETVWDVMAGKGVVTVHEKAGRCVVSVYGPDAAKTIADVTAAMAAAPGYQRLAGAPPPDGLGQNMFFSGGGRSVMVQLKGSDPDDPGHQSRFSVVTATVFAGQ